MSTILNSRHNLKVTWRLSYWWLRECWPVSHLMYVWVSTLKVPHRWRYLSWVWLEHLIDLYAAIFVSWVVVASLKLVITENNNNRTISFPQCECRLIFFFKCFTEFFYNGILNQHPQVLSHTLAKSFVWPPLSTKSWWLVGWLVGWLFIFRHINPFRVI